MIMLEYPNVRDPKAAKAMIRMLYLVSLRFAILLAVCYVLVMESEKGPVKNEPPVNNTTMTVLVLASSRRRRQDAICAGSWRIVL